MMSLITVACAPALNQGKFDRAEELYRRMLGAMEATLGAKHPDLAQTLNNLAVSLESQVGATGLLRLRRHRC